MVIKLYCPISFSQKALIALPKEEHHHLIHVLRAKKGDPLLLINGFGQGAEGTLVACNATQATVQIHSLIEEPLSQITIAMGMSLFSHLQWAIEKGTELGVASFWIFPGERSAKMNLSAQQKERLQKLSISAMKQSGRLTLPEILLKEPLTMWKRQKATMQFFADPRPSAPFLWAGEHSLSTPIVLYIGPEGGWSPNERLHLEDVQKAKPVRLYTHILRAETAVVPS